MIKFLKALLILIGLSFLGAPFSLWLQGPSEYIGEASSVEEAQPVSSEEAIAAYKDGILSSPNVSAFVADVRPGLVDGLVEIQVTPLFLAEPKVGREQLAQALWKTWAYNSVPTADDVDKARIRLVNAQGRQVGGSRAIAGSLIYVDD